MQAVDDNQASGSGVGGLGAGFKCSGSGAGAGSDRIVGYGGCEIDCWPLLQVLVVIGETGSGKTTQMTQVRALLAGGAECTLGLLRLLRCHVLLQLPYQPCPRQWRCFLLYCSWYRSLYCCSTWLRRGTPPRAASVAPSRAAWRPCRWPSVSLRRSAAAWARRCGSLILTFFPRAI